MRDSQADATTPDRSRRYFVGLAVAIVAGLALAGVGLATDARWTATLGITLVTMSAVSGVFRIARSRHRAR